MDMRILYMKYKNIREFRDLEISLVKDKESLRTHHISLIQTANGIGKTTTINLISHAISGSSLSKDYIDSLRPINYDSDYGIFELHMYINNEYIAVRMELDYNNSLSRYFTSRPKINEGGIQDGHKLPLEVENIIKNPKFVKLFVFDAEFSMKLLSNNKDKDYSEAEDAIKVIYSLDKLSGLNNEIDEIVSNKQSSDGSNVTSSKGLNQLVTKLKKLEGYEDDLNKKLSDNEKEIVSKKETYKNKKTTRDELFSTKEEVYNKQKELETGLKTVEQSIKVSLKELISKIRSPANYSLFFHNELENLGNNLIKLKLPKSTSKEFFKELAEGNTCICGEKIDERRKKLILENAEQFLSDDDISVMNAVKGSIKELSDIESVSPLVDKILSEKRNYFIIKQSLDRLSQELPKDIREQVDQLDEEIRKLHNDIEELEKQQDNISTSDKEETVKMKEWENLTVCKEKIKSLRNEIAEVTGTLKFQKQANLLKDINDQVLLRAISKMKEKIIYESNEKIKNLLGRDDVLIDNINGSIFIKNKSGVSQGESVAVGYAYLASLFEGSNHNLPFVIDSPAGSLDKDVRGEVSSLIPSLYKQLIIFIISTERDRFADGFERYDDIQYMTIYKNRLDRNIIINPDRDFFMHFQDLTTKF